MRTTICLFILFLPFSVYCQDPEDSDRLVFDVGFVYHFNRPNETNYLDLKSPFGHSADKTLQGLDLRLTVPSGFKNLDLCLGVIVENCMDEYSGTTTDFKLNGGGVYAGVSPKIGGANLGVSCLFAIGVFSYKEYFVFYRDTPLPVVDINERYASFGLGAMSSLGAYARIGRFGIHPQANVVLSGGNESSFLLFGFIIPLSLTF